MIALNKFALLATVLAGLQMSGISAQTISSQCQSALGNVVASPDASCLNAQGLVGLVLSSSGSSSIVPTVDSWLRTLCGRPSCSNDTLAAVVQNVTTGCQAELTGLGFSDISVPELTSLVQTGYPTVRQVLCLADSSNGTTLCITETLNNVQQYTGTLTPQNIESLASGIFVGGANLPNVPANVTCTDCSKAAYNVIQQGFSGLMPSEYTDAVSQTCGASFVDGAQPSTVTSLASNSQADGSTTVTPNGAAPRFSTAPLVGVAGASIVAIVSAFAMFA